jgi:glycosyltransferase involved in cell wall biosynthesis
MTAPRLSYAAVTPVWNEAVNLERLARCMREQTIAPEKWIIVDTGSTDRTGDVALGLQHDHPWVSFVAAGREDQPAPGAPVVRAFHAGLEQLRGTTDIVVKLDADVSFEKDYFEQLTSAFADDPKLGIASGACWERNESGEWKETQVSAGHVRGATRAYRRSCLQRLLPLEERMGWDGIDELKANTLGWRTKIVPGLAFHHHRAVGARDGSSSARWKAQGRGAHYMGYSFWFLVLRSLYRARSDRAALNMIGGYAAAALRREPRYGDAAVRRQLRSRQKLRTLALEAARALHKR